MPSFTECSKALYIRVVVLFSDAIHTKLMISSYGAGKVGKVWLCWQRDDWRVVRDVYRIRMDA